MATGWVTHFYSDLTLFLFSCSFSFHSIQIQIEYNSNVFRIVRHHTFNGCDACLLLLLLCTYSVLYLHGSSSSIATTTSDSDSDSSIIIILYIVDSTLTAIDFMDVIRFCCSSFRILTQTKFHFDSGPFS